MSRAPIPDETAHGHQPPRVTQFSVFLDNRVGKLSELLAAFHGLPLRLVALSVIDSADHAVIRLVATDAQMTRKTLRVHQLPFAETDILAVELDAQHSLERICCQLLGAEINIHYAYPLMVRPHGAATLAIHCDNQELAGQILLRKHFTLLTEADLNEEPFCGDAPL
jgi:hypothetical protein